MFFHPTRCPNFYLFRPLYTKLYIITIVYYYKKKSIQQTKYNLPLHTLLNASIIILLGLGILFKMLLLVNFLSVIYYENIILSPEVPTIDPVKCMVWYELINNAKFMQFLRT